MLVICSDVPVENASRSKRDAMENKTVEMDLTRPVGVLSIALDSQNTDVMTTSVSPQWTKIPDVMDSSNVQISVTSSPVRQTHVRVMNGNVGQDCVSRIFTDVMVSFSVLTSVTRSAVAVARGSSGVTVGSAWTPGSGVMGRTSVRMVRMRPSVRLSIGSICPLYQYLVLYQGVSVLYINTTPNIIVMYPYMTTTQGNCPVHQKVMTTIFYLHCV